MCCWVKKKKEKAFYEGFEWLKFSFSVYFSELTMVVIAHHLLDEEENGDD